MQVSHLLDFGGRRKTPLVRQSEASECGLACIAMICGYYGLEADMPTYRRLFGIGLRGAQLKDLIAVSDRLGLNSRALRLDVEDLSKINFPAILHWNLNHFVVITGVRTSIKGLRYKIHDPAKGAYEINERDLSGQFTGVALELTKSVRFQPQSSRTKLRFSQMWSGIHGAGSALTGVLCLSIILQIISLASPFYLQLALDNVLPAHDYDLLVVLAAGFGGLVIIEKLSSWLRAISVLNLTNSFSFQIINNLFRHLINLPLSWFERRHVGDIVSRFGSTQPITEFLSQGLVSSVVDGVMASLTLTLMFLYSGKLAAIALIAWLLYTAIRLLSFTAMKASNANSISADARENSAFMETVRGIATIKSYGREQSRQQTWQTLKASAMNARMKLGRIKALFDASAELILAAERIIFVYFAVKMGMDGEFTVGMIFAFQAYKGQFLDASTRLIDQIVKYRLLDVHLTRISDIALSRPEARDPSIKGDAEPLRGEIELRNVSFRYGFGEPFVLTDVNIKINAGEMVAFVGPSGGGKSTLIKLMMGMMEPSSGEILIDGQPIQNFGLRRWRSQIGSVLQEDRLFAGSLAENISFFDPEIDMPQVRRACQRASVLAEIEKTPLGLETLVGDMGSALSGGQKQRVMLARALYCNPAVLFMDEGTANLDTKNEEKVIKTLRDMAATRIVSAHRSAAIVSASRVFVVQGARVREKAAVSL